MNRATNQDPEVSAARLLPAAEDPQLVRVLEEYLGALEAGTAPNRASFLAAYPDMARALDECLDGLEFIRGAALQVREPEAVGPGERASAGQDGIPAGIPLGDYRILREIGRGGMGVVYEAEQMSLGRRVALKVLPFAATLDPRQLQRFKNEAQAAAHLHHTNIVPVISVGCERGVHYYAMQFIEGQTLAAIIRDLRRLAGLDAGAGPGSGSLASQLASGRWAPSQRAGDNVQTNTRDGDARMPAEEGAEVPVGPVATTETASHAASISTQHASKGPEFFRTVADLGVQAAEALEHAHVLGVVHRDIKPANLLLDTRRNLWITDFGLAHCHNQAGLTMAGDLLGTLRYMSPEQALAQRGVIDHRTDIYSLGATLYELLTLEPAFQGDDRQEVLQQIAFTEPRPPRQVAPGLPRELETVVLKAMAKEADARYSTARELADDLRRFLDDRPILAKRPTLFQRLTKWSRRHKSVVGAALVVLLLTVIGLALTTWLVWQADQRTQTALALARSERQHALLRSQDTLEAVDRILHAGRVQLNPLQPLELERKALVAEAITFYLRLLRENPADAKVRLQTARAYGLLSGIHDSLGESRAVEQTAHQAIDLLRGLIAEFPDERAHRLLLVNVQRGLAISLRSQFDRHPEVLDLFHQALDLATQLADRPDCLLELAQTHHDLGYFHYLASRPDEAEREFRRALEVYRRVQTHAPAGKGLQEGQAFVQNSLGVLFRSTWRLAQAEAAHRNALKLLEETKDGGSERLRSLGRLAILLWWKGEQATAERYLRETLAPVEKQVNDYPHLPHARLELSLITRQLAGVLEAAGRREEADQLYAQSRSHLEKLVTDFPGSAGHHFQLAITCSAQASLRANRGQAAIADLSGRSDRALRKAMELDDKNYEICGFYARFLANAASESHRHPARAVELARRALALAPEDRNAWNILGTAHYRNNNAAEALIALQKSVDRRYGGTGADLFFLALTHARLGDLEQARHWHRRGVEWLHNTKREKESEYQRLREESASQLGLADLK